MKKSILKDCMRIARSKLDKHPQLENYIHFSFLVKDNRIVDFATNNSHTPDRKFGYQDRNRSTDFKPKLHSELSLLIHSKRSARECDVVNIRVSKKGLSRLSLPCKFCRNILGVVGVNKVWFTTENSWGVLHI